MIACSRSEKYSVAVDGFLLIKFCNDAPYFLVFFFLLFRPCLLMSCRSFYESMLTVFTRLIVVSKRVSSSFAFCFGSLRESTKTSDSIFSRFVHQNFFLRTNNILPIYLIIVAACRKKIFCSLYVRVYSNTSSTNSKCVHNFIFLNLGKIRGREIAKKKY